MDTEYARTAMDVVSSRELEQIRILADQAEGISDRLEAAIDRFRGNPPTSQQRDAVAPVPSGHAGQLSRLSIRLDQIVNLTHTIAEIM